jgi:hypothetical protein
MFGLFKKKPSFWAWLASHSDRIKAGAPQDMAPEIAAAFERDYRGLVWELGPAKEGPWTFCVSADGDRSRFPAVIKAVEAAPAIPGWTIHAFRQRAPAGYGFRIEMEGHALAADDIWWSAVEEDGGLHLTLWIRGLTSETVSLLAGAAVILLDNALGEFDSVTKIRSLDPQPLPARVPDGLAPFVELPGRVDRLPTS